MTKRTLALAILSTFIIGMSAGAGFAKSETKSLEGTIVTITSSHMTVRQEAGFFASNVEINIADATKLDQLRSLDELEQGSKVKVEYYEEDGKKIASLITPIEPSAREHKGG